MEFLRGCILFLTIFWCHHFHTPTKIFRWAMHAHKFGCCFLNTIVAPCSDHHKHLPTIFFFFLPWSLISFFIVILWFAPFARFTQFEFFCRWFTTFGTQWIGIVDRVIDVWINHLFFFKMEHRCRCEPSTVFLFWYFCKRHHCQNRVQLRNHLDDRFLFF